MKATQLHRLFVQLRTLEIDARQVEAEARADDDHRSGDTARLVADELERLRADVVGFDAARSAPTDARFWA